MESILISIQPKWVAKILNKEKTIEVRKSMPKCDLPIDVYIYCTWGTGKYHQMMKQFGEYHFNKNIGGYCGFNGKVVAKFTLNKVEEIICDNDDYGLILRTKTMWHNQLLRKSCLNEEEMIKYLPIPKPIFADDRNTKVGYAWHIDNLVIFDEPKELNEFMSIKQFNKYKKDLNKAYEEDEITLSRLYNGDALDDECANSVELLEMTKWCYGLTKAPQSWQFIESEN